MTEKHSADTATAMLEQLPTRELHAMLAGGAIELARRWIEETSGAAEYLKTGWGLSVEMVLVPQPGFVIAFIDSDGTRHPHASIPLVDLLSL
jgi:hypothetical protein